MYRALHECNYWPAMCLSLIPKIEIGSRWCSLKQCISGRLHQVLLGLKREGIRGAEIQGKLPIPITCFSWGVCRSLGQSSPQTAKEGGGKYTEMLETHYACYRQLPCWPVAFRVLIRVVDACVDAAKNRNWSLAVWRQLSSSLANLPEWVCENVSPIYSPNDGWPKKRA